MVVAVHLAPAQPKLEQVFLVLESQEGVTKHLVPTPLHAGYLLWGDITIDNTITHMGTEPIQDLSTVDVIIPIHLQLPRQMLVIPGFSLHGTLDQSNKLLTLRSV